MPTWIQLTESGEKKNKQITKQKPHKDFFVIERGKDELGAYDLGYLCSILHDLASSSIVKLSHFNLEAQKSFDVGLVQAVEDADTSVHMCLKKVKKCPKYPSLC